ncbi:MAG TPA: glycogen debranching protein GlgX [Candidatus Dormibacteraeota bacterium]
MEIWPGDPYPLGASFDGTGTNFSLFSEVADRVELCLFDEDGAETRLDLPEQTALCWHGYVPNVRPGQRYGFRVHGPYDPNRGLRCNPAKLLLDPYAKAIEGNVRWNRAIFPYPLGNPDLDKAPDHTDSGPFMPKSIVIDPWFIWDDDRRLRIPWHDTVIYEVHVKGFTARHPSIPANLRGTYAGLATPEAIEHFKSLGITALELLPVHQFVHDHVLIERGLRNYWGYNSIGYLAPHNEYTSSGERGEQVQEFKRMVKTLHSAGIEVILDVVYNHTAEGNHLGPMLSFRGIDNAAYYRLTEDARFYRDYTGTGNSLNMRHPHVLQLIMDSLRYWVIEMHVDGFRFDLAATLARELHDVDRLSAFFDLVQQDPVLSQVKLIAEPWDVGEGGYQVGNFPVQWSEWNGKYRDTVRDFWRGEPATLADFGFRITGSSDLYQADGRRPYASVNFVTCHDGFTLEDLVSYNHKRNEANGEDNQDGESHNRSWNCGIEGVTDDPEVRSLRDRQKRNFLATVLLSQGVPMILSGDEFGRTQCGNNNAYCQDNEISWLDWEHRDDELMGFVTRLIRLRREHPVFRRRRFFQGRRIQGAELTDIAWFKPDGGPMTADDWSNGYARSLGVFLNGEEISAPDPRGRRPRDDSFFVLFNAYDQSLRFTLPRGPYGRRWMRILDTADPLPRFYRAGGQVPVAGRSLALLRKVE